MANEISLIPKDYKGEKRSGLRDILSKVAILAVVLVVLSLLAWGGLSFYNKSLGNRLAEISTQIEEIDEQRNEELEKELKSLDKIFQSLKTVLENHLFWSNFFSKLENLTVPEVYFLDFGANIEQEGFVKLMLSGETSSYTYLARQMKSFSQESMVSEVEASGIGLGPEGGLAFELSINFSKDILFK